jgi:hypothetical protein
VNCDRTNRVVWLVWKSTCHNKTRTLQYNICLNFLIALRKSKINRAISVSQIMCSIQTARSIGSWISDYKCKQCLSPLILWAWIPLMARCTRYNFPWYICISFIVWRNRSTRRRLSSCRNSLKQMYHGKLYRVHLAMSGIQAHRISGDRHC